MFKTIINLFNPLDKENVTPSSEANVDNKVELRTNLLNAIVKYFIPYYRGKKFSDTIVIWVNNEMQLLQAEVRDKSFEEDLRTEFANNQYDVLIDAPLIFETRNPLASSKLKEIIPGVFIELRPLVIEKREVPSRAKISTVSGSGSLLKYEIMLNAAKQKTYNIGRSEVVDNNGRHINHIAINDNESDEAQAKINNCVSRMHAKILFKDNVGFCLMPLAGGCRALEGSATKILRGEKQHELRDINMLFPLCDGDLIELGKAVRLKFKFADEESATGNQSNSAFKENDLGI